MSGKGPSFEAWSIENLIKFSSEAYEKLCEQDDYIQQLQCDLKTAIEAYRKLNKDLNKPEPVAWYRDEDGIRIYYESKVWDDATPLYTAPRQRIWVGLTDDEIEQGCKESWVTEGAWQSAVWWAEAKLKEKNR